MSKRYFVQSTRETIGNRNATSNSWSAAIKSIGTRTNFTNREKLLEMSLDSQPIIRVWNFIGHAHSLIAPARYIPLIIETRSALSAHLSCPCIYVEMESSVSQVGSLSVRFKIFISISNDTFKLYSNLSGTVSSIS